MLLHWFMFVVHDIKQQEVSKILLIHVLAARKKPIWLEVTKIKERLVNIT